MKKNYVAVVYYEGALQISVNAENEEEAEKFVRAKVENLPPEVFGENLACSKLEQLVER